MRKRYRKRGCGMIPYERHELILKTLREQGLVKIDELHEVLTGVSLSTLRRDLKELERRGSIEYLAGGAVKLHETAREIDISVKETLHAQEKERIGARAAAEVEDGETVYIDSGSTCTAMLKHLLDRPVTIYTTSAGACAQSVGAAAKVVVIGGMFNPVTSSFTGPLTESILTDLYFEKAFLGINSLDDERGVMSPGFAEAAKKRIVRVNSNKVYVLCDSSKFHGFSNVKVFDLDGLTIISDKNDAKIGERARILVA